MIELRALGALLSYPHQEMRQALPEIREAIHASPLIARREREALDALIEALAAGELLTVQARYVDVFDRGRGTCLNLFEHLYGDGRDRGSAMVELTRVYEAAGFELATCELPDYLPVVLEYLSCRDLTETRDMLADCAHLIERIARALARRASPYAAVPNALLVIAGEVPVAGVAEHARADRDDDPDKDWFEPPAFGGEPLTGPGTST